MISIVATVLLGADLTGCSGATGEGAGGGPETGGGGGLAADCFEPPGRCDEDVDCCDGGLCVMVQEDVACHPACERDAECDTGCCAPLLGGGMACLAADFCATPL